MPEAITITECHSEYTRDETAQGPQVRTESGTHASFYIEFVMKTIHSGDLSEKHLQRWWITRSELGSDESEELMVALK
jgi:hypothetical protein